MDHGGAAASSGAGADSHLFVAAAQSVIHLTQSLSFFRLWSFPSLTFYEPIEELLIHYQ